MSESSKESEDKLLWWRDIQKEDCVLTLWPGCVLKTSQEEEFRDFMKNHFDVEVDVVGIVETLPDKDWNGNIVEDTGGRHDLFFWVHMPKEEDKAFKFAIKRLRARMRWWEDVYFNNGQDIYPQNFLNAFPDPA